MATIPRSIRIDENLHSEAQKVFEQLGIPLAVAVNVFLKYVVREQGIPFAVTLKKTGENHEKI